MRRVQHAAQPQTLARELARGTISCGTALLGSHARVSAGRVALDAACVQLGYADLGLIGADGNSNCSSVITMAWSRKSSATGDLSCAGRPRRRSEGSRARHSNAVCVSYSRYAQACCRRRQQTTQEMAACNERPKRRHAEGETHPGINIHDGDGSARDTIMARRHIN